MMSLSVFVSTSLVLSQLAAAAIPANTPTALRIVTVSDNTTNCLTANGASNGVDVNVQSCSGSDAQENWILPSGIPDIGSSAAQAIKFGNLCLDVTGGTDAIGTGVQLWTCSSGSKNQQWIVNVNNGFSTIQWAGHSKCLENIGDAHNGTQSIIDNCTTGQVDQKWIPINASRTQPPGTPVEFGHGKDRKTCFGATGLYNGAPVQIVPCEPESQSNNTWIQSSANGPITLGGDFCLDVTDGKDSNGTPLQLWTCEENSGNQRWTLGQDETIQWYGKGKCVDLTNGNVTAGNTLQLWSCSASNPNQQWISLPPL